MFPHAKKNVFGYIQRFDLANSLFNTSSFEEVATFSTNPSILLSTTSAPAPVCNNGRKKQKPSYFLWHKKYVFKANSKRSFTHLISLNAYMYYLSIYCCTDESQYLPEITYMILIAELLGNHLYC